MYREISYYWYIYIYLLSIDIIIVYKFAQPRLYKNPCVLGYCLGYIYTNSLPIFNLFILCENSAYSPHIFNTLKQDFS